MAWRAFVDEQTPEGLHIIFTNDDSLTEATIRNVWEPKDGLKRFGKVINVLTMADVTTFCTNEISRLNNEDSSDIQLGFITPTVAPAPDAGQVAKAAAEKTLSMALSSFDQALKIAEADPSFDISKYKLAVIDAQVAVQAATK